MKARYTMFAGYNHWANERLYDAAETLPDIDYRADRGAFFKSVHNTLNHLVVTDRIWMRRFTGDGPMHTRLDDVPYADRDTLRAARRAEDARISAWIEGLSDAQLAATLRYRSITNPAETEQVLCFMLDHLFNHQTHHRGQVHCLLTQFGCNAPSLDLVLFQRECGLARKL